MDATIVSYKQAVGVITDIFASGIRANYLDGMPGIGKTFMAKYIQANLGLRNRFIIKAAHHDVVDFGGVPVPDLVNKVTHFYPSADLLPPTDLKGGCLMVWDEAADCPVAIQNMICQAVFEGGLHGYRFPEDTFHFLTGNRVADRSGANRVVTKLGNRVAWQTLVPLKDEVFEYGISSGWNPTVLAFLKLKGDEPINVNDRKNKDGSGVIPTYFNSFDPQDPAQMVKPVFASSRSIEFVSNLLNYIERTQPAMKDGDLLTRVASLVGTPWATAFVPFRSEATAMPDPDAVLRGEKVPLPKKESVLWALTISLVTRCTKTNWRYVDRFLKQGPAEYRILAVRLAFDTRASSLIGPDFNATLQEADVQQALKAK